MKRLVLSDHTGAQIQAARSRRDQELAAALATREQLILTRAATKDAAKQQLGEAWARRHAWNTVTALLRLAKASLAGTPPHPRLRPASRDEEVWLVGFEGEQHVADWLAARLGDEWTLVSGYKNAKGEIDQLLVGPPGAFAIEVKTQVGTIYCDGDRWWRDKSDKYGNLVERNVPMGDARGRSPSRQLNEAADRLQSFLTKRVGVARVARAVIFAHDNARIGALKDVKVDCVATLSRWELSRFLKGPGADLTLGERERVLAAIAKDHGFHESPPRTAAPGQSSQSGAATGGVASPRARTPQ